jgi:signal recognition particle receptor subunit beta
MASINYASKEISCKIVFYGPGLSGKTTNLQYVHKKIPPQTRGDLISLATDQDRTLYFDFLPVDIGKVHGFSTKFQLYTVPGQVYYNATRKLVLRGVDGLVFVADSQKNKMDENIESLQNLVENLSEYGYKIERIPLVLQYNKRDLPDIMPVEEMEKSLNAKGLHYFEAVATTGLGVFDTLKCISKLVLDQARRKQLFPERETVPTETEEKPTEPDISQPPKAEPHEIESAKEMVTSAPSLQSKDSQATVATIPEKVSETYPEKVSIEPEKTPRKTLPEVKLDVEKVEKEEKEKLEKRLAADGATIISWSAGKSTKGEKSKGFFLWRWLSQFFK